jgi:hypothetical protein
MTRQLQNRDIDDPIDRIVREFCAQHDIAAFHHSDLAAPLKEHVREVLIWGLDDATKARAREAMAAATGTEE